MRKTRKMMMRPLMLLSRSLTRKVLLIRAAKEMMMSLRLRMCQTSLQRMLRTRRRKKRARSTGPMRVSSRMAKIMPEMISPKMLWRTF